MLRHSSRAFALGLVTSALFYLAACGGDSSLPTGASSSGSSATIHGTVNDLTASASSAHGEVSMASHHAGIRVTVVETGQTTETNGSGEFVVSVPAGTITLHFQGPKIDAELKIGGLVAGQTLTITIHVSGSHAGIDDDGGGTPSPSPNPSPSPSPTAARCFAPGAKAEVEGNIDAKDASSITVMQQGKGDYHCSVSPSTRIRKGNTTLTLDDLAVGAHVHVSGTGGAASGGVCEVEASEIKLQ